MTERNCILIDFENVQPAVEELALLRDGEHHVVIFHGPHQNKFDAAMVKALQPLGADVEYVQCARNGKNALDFHIAFYLGRLVRDGERDSGARAGQYIIVSKDSGFEALLEHLQSLGHAGRMVPSVREAVTLPAPLAMSLATVKQVAPKKAVKRPASPAKQTAPTLRERLIENLRAHPENRPSSLPALERHIATLAGSAKPSPESIAALIDGLAGEGVVTVGDKTITYAVPSKAKAGAGLK
jgi:hypothetical protein